MAPACPVYLRCSLQALQCARPSLRGQAHPLNPKQPPPVTPCPGCVPQRDRPHPGEDRLRAHLPCLEPSITIRMKLRSTVCPTVRKGYVVPTAPLVGLCRGKRVALEFPGRDLQRPGLGGRSSKPLWRHPPAGPTPRSCHPDRARVFLGTPGRQSWTRHAVFIGHGSRARKGDPGGGWELGTWKGQENHLQRCL